jgi:hypothetical protein
MVERTASWFLLRLRWREWNRAPGNTIATGLRCSNLSYGARFEARFPPMQSWRSMNSVLLTCHGEINRGGARDGKAVQVLQNGGASGFQRWSDLRNDSGSDGLGWVSSSRRWIDARCLRLMDRRQRLAGRWRLGWGKIRTGKGLFVGGNDLGCRGHGV